MELLDDVGHVESHSGPFGDCVSIGAYRCMVCAEYTIGSENRFWTHPMVLLGDVGQVESCFSLLGAIVGAR